MFSPMETDAMLVGRVLGGDAGAYGTLVDRHAPACLRFATCMLESRDEAEAATRAALLAAYRTLRRYDPHMPFRGWLFAILIDGCRDALLARCRRARIVTYDGDRPWAPVADRADVARAVSSLEPAYREALLLKHVEELSYGEMATATRLTVPALKTRVRDACDRLQSLLATGAGADARP